MQNWIRSGQNIPLDPDPVATHSHSQPPQVPLQYQVSPPSDPVWPASFQSRQCELSPVRSAERCRQHPGILEVSRIGFLVPPVSFRSPLFWRLSQNQYRRISQGPRLRRQLPVSTGGAALPLLYCWIAFRWGRIPRGRFLRLSPNWWSFVFRKASLKAGQSLNQFPGLSRSPKDDLSRVRRSRAREDPGNSRGLVSSSPAPRSFPATQATIPGASDSCLPALPQLSTPVIPKGSLIVPQLFENRRYWIRTPPKPDRI